MSPIPYRIEGGRHRNRRTAIDIQSRMLSNDSSNDSEEVGSDLGLVGGYPTTYSCDRYVDASEQIHTVHVNFNLELLVRNQKDEIVDDSYYLPALEWGILWSVANAVELRSCNLEDQKIDSWSGRRKATSNGNRNLIAEVGSSHVVSLTTTDLSEEDAMGKDFVLRFLSANGGLRPLFLTFLLLIIYFHSFSQKVTVVI